MMARLTNENRQRLTKQLDNLQIELGYLRQVATSILELFHVVGAQLETVTDIMEKQIGQRAT